MRKRKRIYLALLAFSVALVVLGSGLTALAGSAYAEPQAASPSYAITWDVVASGGTSMTSGSYTMLSTTGQPVTGEASGTSHSLLSGYWQGIKSFFRYVFLPLLRK